MQFDAVHIVSGGVDNSVCITDIATGEVYEKKDRKKKKKKKY